MEELVREILEGPITAKRGNGGKKQLRGKNRQRRKEKKQDVNSV